MFSMEESRQHSPQIKIDKMRRFPHKEGPSRQHRFKGHEGLRELRHQLRLLGPPLLQAAAAELSFFVAQETQALRLGHKFLPINIVQLETRRFNLVFDISPQNPVHSAKQLRKKVQLKFSVHV